MAKPICLFVFSISWEVFIFALALEAHFLWVYNSRLAFIVLSIYWRSSLVEKSTSVQTDFICRSSFYLAVFMTCFVLDVLEFLCNMVDFFFFFSYLSWDSLWFLNVKNLLSVYTHACTYVSVFYFISSIFVSSFLLGFQLYTWSFPSD